MKVCLEVSEESGKEIEKLVSMRTGDLFNNKPPLGIIFFLSHFSCAARSVTQSCPTVCEPMDCRLPGSCAPGIFRARILEQGAISYSRGSS